MSTREKAKIAFVAKGDRGEWWIRCEGPGWSQGFGGICLAEDSKEDRAFRDELAAFFGVRWIHDAVGKECYVLRCFDIHNEPIEGFEYRGKVWTLTDFRRRHFPEHAKTRLQEQKDYYGARIDGAHRQIEDAKRMLSKLDSMFVDWSVIICNEDHAVKKLRSRKA